VEHRGFEPRTPCLPEQWQAFQSLSRGPFSSQRVHQISTPSALLRGFLSGLVVSLVVKFRATESLDPRAVLLSIDAPFLRHMPSPATPFAGHPVATTTLTAFASVARRLL
jgi:hypothetical protein